MGGLRDYPFRIFYGPVDDRLHDFYLPALERSVAYDRSAGFFSSSALAVAAAGIARLIQNGGRMRLLVGAQLEPEDVTAIVAGQDLAAVVRARLLAGLTSPADELMRDRLAALAWMVAEGTLEIRVVLPCDQAGRPLPAAEAEEYFHPKEGIFTDRVGDQVAFSGSVNESARGWLQNYEQFAVYFSWNETRPYLEQVRHRFERLWEGRETGWIALPLPEAVRERLLTYRPPRSPKRDPLERRHEVIEAREEYVVEQVPARERLVAQYLRDAPLLVGADDLGLATAPIEPWPHQVRVVRTLVERFPERFLLADEVGLGKTIEAGLALRQLVLSRRVRRALLLVPDSVLRQWQEELWEKFCLAVPRYDGGRLWSVHGESWEPACENPFASVPLLLVSSQLAKRRDRAPQVLAAGPWDLVIVDEAHHARRSGSEGQQDRPNRLLELLQQLSGRTRGLWLLTATPMQLHPVELWDLLVLLGLGGTWGSDPEPFLRFYRELRRDPAELDWSAVLPLAREEVAVRGIDPAFEREAERELGLVGWRRLHSILTGESRAAPQYLDRREQVWLAKGVRRHTPLMRLMFRHTRALLRRYAAQGLVDARVPERDPEVVWISMTPAERALYDRIEEYIAEFYGRFEEQRRGLGFVMAVYRRRLTSSFHAVHCSLQRRLEYLRRQRRDLGLMPEDVEDPDLREDISEELPEALQQTLREETAYLEDFVRELALLGDDSKLETLLERLNTLFRSHETVVIFTQYTDTMDYLRDQLRQIYGPTIACYSGRGGEIWQDGEWRRATKEAIKNAFRSAEIKILLCTDAASEGLNLQTCGALINFDLPWNPMRVEQRIGRIDRIGQQYPSVRIVNLFYEGTIEAEVYRRLRDRIDWFRSVVGELQPILSQVERVIERVSLQPRERREQELVSQLTEIEKKLAAGEPEALDLVDGEAEVTWPRLDAVPVTLADLERIVPTLPGIAERFFRDRSTEGLWLVSVGDRLQRVTFDRRVFDEHSQTVRLLTYGEPLLDELLALATRDGAAGGGAVLRLHRDGDPPLYGYYRLTDEGPVWISNVQELEQALASGAATWSGEAVDAAQRDFAQRCERVLGRWQERIARRQSLFRSQLVARGRRLLVEAALTALALKGRQSAFSGTTGLRFGRDAIDWVRQQKYPFAPLAVLVGTQGLEARMSDPLWEELREQSPERLRGRWERLKREAERLVEALAAETAESSDR